MRLELKRIAKRPTYTIGRLFIDGKYFCDTCEDCDRGLRDDMPLEYIKHAKIYGITAIPTGTYKVELTYSQKFKRVLPEIKEVKGYTGIRIHGGNTADNSLGCVLVGENKAVGKVLNSRATMDRLMPILLKAKDMEITIS